MRLQAWLAALALLAPTASWAAPPAPALVLADTIDRHIAAGWDKAKVKPVSLADDSEFLRRVNLHLAGRIPSVSEARAFLRDTTPDKRQRIVRQLLDSPRYVAHHVNVWRNWMMPEADASIQAQFLVPGFENWLREKLRDNVGYDRMVHELLTTPMNGGQGAFFYGGGGGSANPSSFYLSKELKAENLGASTARLFLGIRLECAQCHNHPFADWKKEQFWQFAAFFSGIRGQNQGDFVNATAEQPDKKNLTIPNSEKVVQARFPDGTEPNWKVKEPTRKTLADWVTSEKNPYFARATVNRMWEYFFGLGLIDPVDEMVGAESKSSHPGLLDELAKEFAANRFDLKFLIRAITASKTYQLSSSHARGTRSEPRLFARFPLRGMTAEQLYDSVAQATGYHEGNTGVQGAFIVGGARSPRQEFVTRFAEQTGKSTESQTSILQALALMNGKLVEDATSLERSETLLAVVDNPFMSLTQRIETLYLASLSRMPAPKEISRMLRFIEETVKSSKAEEREQKEKQALADVFWVLLNSGEFVLNH
jgi:Protein of unknown function (DUF1553)/Protein of unknown function (DUF1549)